MDIKPPLNANLQFSLNQVGADGLKIGQTIEAKVVETQIMLGALSLKVGEKNLIVQTDRPVSLQFGQLLKLQVVKLLPMVEFKLLPTQNFEASPLSQRPPDEIVTLKLLSSSLATSQSSSKSMTLSTLITGEQLRARVVNITPQKITLQLAPSTNSQIPNNRPSDPVLMTLDVKQLLFNNLPSAFSALKPSLPMPSNLTIGSEITLQVEKLGHSPTFTVLTKANESDQNILEALKHLLPIQASPTVLLNHLQLALPHLQSDASVAETLKNLAHLILQGTPSKTQLTEATQLKQVMTNSGLFLESKLAELLSGKQEISLQDDFKLKLGKFIQLINQEIAGQTSDKSTTNQELLKESLQKAQSALAKLTLDQLQSLPRDESPKQSWTLELPFFHNQANESVKIEVEQDKANTEDNPPKNWAVSITITPPDLATIHCKISCYDGSVNTLFWSEAADTVDKINAHLDYLKVQFESKGLTSGFMQAHQGLPSQTDSISVTPMSSLLSEKA